MVLHLQSLFCALILASCTFIARSDVEFPKLSQLEVDFYEAEVTVTNKDQQITAFAKEYYDSAGGPRGRVDTVSLGEEMSVFYNNATNEIYEVKGDHCDVWDVEDSIFSMDPIFYGWLLLKPLVIGPSAPLWYAEDHRDEIKYEGSDFQIRDIMCDKFSLEYLGDKENYTFYYYFANDGWKTPYYLKGFRTIVRIEIIGTSNRDTRKDDQVFFINQYTDFAYFRATISDWRSFQPPLGIGCLMKKLTRTMPKFPNVYMYSAEVVDLLKSDDHAVSDIQFQKVWYDGENKYARLDKYTKKSYFKELYDFNTGVTYSIQDGWKCKINPLRNSFFEGYDGKMMGHLKEPGEVLGLDGEFYYMGKKLIRGIWADVFESVQEDVDFMQKSLDKLVVTVYYSQEYYKVVVNGETESQIPVFYAVKGIDDKNNVKINLQYNIFAFNDVIYPDIYATMGVSFCFPTLDTKSHFALVFDVGTELAAKMEEQDDYMMEQLRGRITEISQVSDLRLPFLMADYRETGVIVTGIMLDRPPALKQFWMVNNDTVQAKDRYLKVAPASKTTEECAFSCVEESSFKCTGFFFCNEACFIKSKDFLDPNEAGDKEYDFNVLCQEYLRAERNSDNKEAYLNDAMQRLEDAVLNSTITIRVIVEVDGKTGYTDATASDIIIDDSPYTDDGLQEQQFKKIMSYAKLDPEDETTEEISYVDNLNDCYKACKESEDITCSSFSYCPYAMNRQCLISSVLIVDRKTNADDTVEDNNCFVFSMKYLDFYDPYPGRVVTIAGDDVFNKVKTVEECAQKCRQAKHVFCRGFEYCSTEKTCVLHSKHVLDMKPGEVIISNRRSTCIHYAAKYAADYYDMGYSLIDDKSDVRTEISLEDCAKTCSEELKSSCKSFNYCPKTGPYNTDSSCALSTQTLKTPRVVTTKKPPCHHYEKKSDVEDWADGSNKKGTPLTSGYTSKGFTGLVIGMLVLGLVLGAVGFVVYSYFRSKSSGEGMTVRFMKQENI